MNDDQIDETLQRLQTFANFVEQLEPLPPALDKAIDDLCADTAQIAKRLEELRGGQNAS